jgi:cytochrome c
VVDIFEMSFLMLRCAPIEVRIIAQHTTTTARGNDKMTIRKAILFAAVLFAATPVSIALAEGDAAAGEKAFNKCKACHTAEQGGANRVGPNLHGVVGRKAGTVDGYSYSKPVKEGDVTWTEDNLDKYLTDPKGFIPGNKMAFPGIKSEDERENIIAYLKQNS